MARYKRLKDGTFQKIDDSEPLWDKKEDGTFTRRTNTLVNQQKQVSTPQLTNTELHTQAERNIAKKFGTYEQFAAEQSKGKTKVMSDLADKTSKTMYQKLIEEEKNRLASGSEFYGITNKGYQEYLDNFSKNAKDKQQTAWLEQQRKNLDTLKNSDIRETIEKAVFNEKISGGGSKKSRIDILSRELNITREQAESLYDTVEREQNAKHSKTLEENADEMTERGFLGKAAAHFLSIGANIESTLGVLDSIGKSVKNKITGEYEPIDTNASGYAAGNFRDRARGNIEADIVGEDAPLWRKGLGTIYQGASSAFDSLGQGLVLGPTGAMLAMGGQAATGTTKETFERTGSNSKAITTGLVSGGIEALTEKMGLDNMWDILQNSGKAALRSTLVNILAQSGIEGVEEMTSEALNTVADYLINQTDSNISKSAEGHKESGLSDKEAWKKAFSDAARQVGKAGLTGAVAGIFGGAAGSALSTSYSKNEKQVIEKEVERRISEKQGKVTAKEKAEIRKEVQKDLEKGYIDIDTIESTLGGKTYDSYQNLSKEMEEYQRLNKMKAMELTGEQSDRLAELKEKNKQASYESEQARLKEQLSKEISDMTVNDRFLRESYNEKGRRSQAFDADVNTYDEKQRTIIQNAIDSGILNNTRRTHEFVDMIAKISADKGVSFDFTDNQRLKESGFAKEGVSINGYIKDGNVTLNVNSAKALNKVVGHEITHVLEGSDLYAELQEAVKAYATTKGEYKSKLEAITKLYEGVEGANVEQELTADLIGEYLFTDEAFVQQLSAQNRNIFQKIYDEIKYLCKVVSSGSKEAKQLEKVKRTFEKVYKGTAKDIGNKDRVRYNVSEDDALYKYIQDSLEGKLSKKSSYDLSNSISERLAKDIENILGFSVEGYKNKISPGNIEHINKEHGIDGRSDKSMSDLHDLAKIKYVIENYDNLRGGKLSRQYKNSDGSFAKTIELQKKIDDKFYYVVEAVPDTKSKSLYVVSAYINKNDTFSEVAVSEDPSRYVQDELQTNVSSKNSIPQTQKKTSKSQKFSITGVKSRTADSSLLLKAEHMLDTGVDSEVVRQETGWYQGYDGKMRFEIDDSESYLIEDPILQQHEDDGNTYFTGKLSDILKHDKLYNAYPKLQDMKVIIQETEPGVRGASFKDSIVLSCELFQRYTKDYKEYLDGGRKAEIEKIEQSPEYKEYDKYYEDTEFQESDPVRWLEEEKKARDKFFSSELGKRYHQLKWGKYNGQKYELGWSKQAQEVLIHEIQHTIQDIEEFTKGSSEGYWQHRINEGHSIKTIEQRKRLKDLEEEYGKIAENDKEFFDDMMTLEDLVPDVPRGKFDFETFEQVEEDPIEWQEFDRIRDELAEKYGDDKFMDFQDLKYELKSLREKSMSAGDAYWRTAGEIEARDTANRLGLTEEQRKAKRPNIDSKEVVLREYSLGDDIAPAGKWNVKGSDITLDDSTPIRKDIAPAQNQETSEEWNHYEPDDLTDGPFTMDDAESTLEDEEAIQFKEANKRKVKNIQAKIQGLQVSKDVTKREFSESIAKKKEEYEGLKRKDTVKASKLLEQITNLEYRRDNTIAELDRKIEGQRKAMDNIKKQEVARQRKRKQNELQNRVRELIGDTSTWKDKKNGISYQVNTLRRNLRDVVRDADGNRDIVKADEIYDALQGKYNINEAELNREANRIKKEFGDLKINAAENAYIQMLGEYRHNPDTTISAEVIGEYYEKHKSKIDNAKVDKAIETARKLYDSLFYRVNSVLREQGMQEIGYREGYFPHFTEEKQGVLGKIFNWKTQNNDIPTDIAGLTEQFNPNRSWQSFNKHRTGDDTDYNFMKGLDNYVNGALDWIYHIEDIQMRRAFENEIRYRHSEKGIQEKIDAVRNNPFYDADEAQAEIDKILKEAKNPLNNFVTDLRKGTNVLAGKKDSGDRYIEEKTSRKIYSTMTNISNRVTANMVAGSVSSALTNFIPITQSWGQVSPVSSVIGMAETIKSYVADDGTVDKSNFLTNRLRQNKNLYQTGWDKAGNAIGFMMEAVDNFTSQTVWRSKYMENIKNGMREEAAIKDADQFAENVIAGRSRGNMPTIFNEKNLITKMFTAFQLEVGNQYGYMLKDMPQDMRNERKGKLVKGYVSMFVGAYAYNALYSALTGRDAAFDPIRILQELLGDLFGDDEEEGSITEAITNLATNVVEETPFIGGLVGGGRIPISSALPYEGLSVETLTGVMNDLSEGNMKNFWQEILKPVYYVAMPMGGGQTRKTIQGLQMFDDDLPIAGSYTNSGKLRFSVDDDIPTRIQAAVFGQYANENAREYFDEGRSPLNEKKTQELADLDIPISDYWDIQDGLKEHKKLADKIDYIADLDLPIAKKNILANNLSKRKEPIDLTDYDLYGNIEELDYATSNPEKYKVAKAVGGYSSYKTYMRALNGIKANKDKNGNAISGSRKTKVVNYINGLSADYGTKLILFKREFPGDDTYNKEIVEYLNKRKDLSHSDVETILKELGFKVDSKGTVRW